GRRAADLPRPGYGRDRADAGHRAGHGHRSPRSRDGRVARGTLRRHRTGAAMNDDQLMTAVRDSFADVRLDVPVEQTPRRGRALRGRSRAYRGAGVAAVAAIAGLTAVAVTGLGRAIVPATASP